MTTIIEKIRAEVNRQREEIRPTDTGEMKVVGTPTQLEQGWLNALSWVEKVLDTLKEQPVNLDIRKELASIEFIGVNDARDSETIARHFAKWGAEHCGSSETPNDLEEAAEEESMWAFSEPTAQGYAKRLFFKSGFKAGAKWQKEQMKRFVEENIGRVSILFADAVAMDAIDHEFRKCDFKNGAEWVIGKVTIEEVTK